MRFNPFNPEDSDLIDEIATNFKIMKDTSPDTEDYTVMVDNQVKLFALKQEGLSKNTVAIILGNIGIAAGIIMFEKHNVITTKLPTFLMKMVK